MIKARLNPKPYTYCSYNITCEILVAAKFELSLGPAHELSIASHANAKSLHALRPIRMPLPICANQDACVVITPKLPKANSIHTAVRPALERTRL